MMLINTLLCLPIGIHVKEGSCGAAWSCFRDTHRCVGKCRIWSRYQCLTEAGSSPRNGTEVVNLDENFSIMAVLNRWGMLKTGEMGVLVDVYNV